MSIKSFVHYLSIVLIGGSALPSYCQEAAVIKELSQDFSEVAQNAIPAVVSIQVESEASGKTSTLFGYESPFDLFQDDFFGRFFDLPQKEKSPSRLQVSQASGFLVSEDGYIATNNHVVGENGKVVVRLNDGQEFQARIIGKDPSTDIAIIKIDAKNLPYLKLGNSDRLKVGQWVVAIGNPLGLQASLTVGVVSAKGRNNLDIARVEDFIQTDAAINRGNSGGPLLNLQGEVMGMNTAIATTYTGIGFAIPSNIAKHVMEQLIAKGSVARGYLGLLMQEIDRDLAQAFDLKKAEGVLVSDVVKGSPAEKGGVKQGDIVLRVNQQPIDTTGALRSFIALQSPGSQISLDVLRNNRRETLSIDVGALQGHEEGEKRNTTTTPLPLGIEVESVTADDARRLNLKEMKGVFVAKVDATSPAAFVGIKKGALILEVNQKPIHSKEEYQKAIQASPSEKPILLLIQQGESIRYVSIRLTK